MLVAWQKKKYDLAVQYEDARALCKPLSNVINSVTLVEQQSLAESSSL